MREPVRPPAMIEMRVSRLVADPFSNLPVLILDDGAGGQIAIGIGHNEAPAIASELANIEMQRPIAHDLIKTIVGQCGARVESVELRDVRKETFYATLVLRVGGERVEVDARPSDAIAVALRTRARIHVARKVIEKSQRGTAPERPRAASEARSRLGAGAGTGTGSAAGAAAAGAPARSSRAQNRSLRSVEPPVDPNAPSRHLVMMPDPEDPEALQAALEGAWLLEALHDEDFGKWKM